MGRIRHVLEQRSVDEPILNRRLTVELCENVHLHYRNFRLEFGKDEFLLLLRHLKTLDESRIEQFEYGHGRFELLLEDQELPKQTEWDRRLQVEEQVEGHYHVHFRNLRVELRDLKDFAVRPPLRTYAIYLYGRSRRFAAFQARRVRSGLARRLRRWLVPLQPWSWRGHKASGDVGIDADFYARYLWRNPSVRGIRRTTMRLSRLLAHIHTPQGDRFLPILDTPAARYLVGDKPGYAAYHTLENAFNVHDERQFDALIESVKSKGYDFERSAIVIFNGEPVIRDGQHRAAILYHLHGDIDVTVADVEFTDARAYAQTVAGSVLQAAH